MCDILWIHSGFHVLIYKLYQYNILWCSIPDLLMGIVIVARFIQGVFVAILYTNCSHSLSLEQFTYVYWCVKMLEFLKIYKISRFSDLFYIDLYWNTNTNTSHYWCKGWLKVKNQFVQDVVHANQFPLLEVWNIIFPDISQ